MKNELKFRTISVAGDCLTTFFALVVFNIIRYNLFVTNIPNLPMFMTNDSVVLGEVLMTGLLMLIYSLSGYYYRSQFRSRVTEFIKTFLSTLIGALIFYFVILINDSVADIGDIYEMVGILWGVLFLMVYSLRLFLTIALYKRGKYSRKGYNTLIIGTSQAARKLARSLMESPGGSRYNVVGFIESDATEATELDGFPVRPLAEIAETAEKLEVTNLILMPCRSGFNDTFRLLNSLFPLGLNIYVSPTLFYLISGRASIFDLHGETLIDVSTPRMSSLQASFKRFFDIVGSALALATIWPAFVAIAVAIKCETKGPVFFLQERMGRNKSIFKIVKFRSMYDNSETDGPALSSADDTRITRVGRVLRKYRLDELPQFWNVLKGEMSIVGPRPERKFYVDLIIKKAPYYSLVHQVRPGITSLGMVKFGYAETVEEMIDRLKYDLIYIENVSIGLDLRIMLYTVKTVLTGRGV